MPAPRGEHLCTLSLCVGLFPAPAGCTKTLCCHSLQECSVSLMNGPVPQFPDEKGEGQREQGACPRSWVELWEPGWALGSAGWFPFHLSLSSVLCSDTFFCQLTTKGTSTPHPHLAAISSPGKSASFWTSRSKKATGIALLAFR